MEETRQIIFDFDNDNRPIRDEKIEGKLFEYQYNQALHQIESYLMELELEKTEENQEQAEGKSYTEHIGEDIDYNNNIFAFMGDRGSGKTSCMISVAGMLTDKKDELIEKLTYIKKDKFVTIDLIDPAYFDKSHNLLSLFLAKLYKSFTQQIDKIGKTHISTSDKQDFLYHYREAHAQLHRLYHEKSKDNFSDEDLMEFVEDASASVNLKRTIKDLVDSYIDCFHWKDTILILRIDDVDMDFDHASMMIESMRKYFVQPNMLVFVSCSLEQLKIIKTRDFMDKVKDEDLKIWCEELADRYLAKVFPQNHCIQMPAPATYHDYKLRLNGKFTTEAGRIVMDEEAERNSRDFISVKQAVLELILKKTRYLFYNTNYYESYIIPQNLRELRQLMKLLITMPDYNDTEEGHPHNKTLFKEYFFGTWVLSNLDDNDRMYVNKMRSVHDMSLFNKTLRVIIYERFLDDPNMEPKEKAVKKKEILNRHITTADILAVISDIEPNLVEERDRKFLFFVKSYYSMLLYDTYCEIREDVKKFGMCRNLKRKQEGLDAKTTTQIIRQDKLNEFYDYEKLIGGCFFNLDNSCEIVLKAQKLRQLVDNCIALFAKKKLTKEDNAKILFAELLVLSIKCARKNENDEGVDYYCQMKDLPSDNIDYQFVINTGSLLFNMTRYDQSICRYSENFYRALIGSKTHKNFKNLITAAEKEDNDYGYIHRVSLRNFEVLQDIVNGYGQSDDRTAQGVFFNEIKYLANYSFPLYEYEKGNVEYNRIRLTFLQLIEKGIKPILNKTDFVNKLFDNSQLEKQNTTNVTGSAEAIVSESTAG